MIEIKISGETAQEVVRDLKNLADSLGAQSDRKTAVDFDPKNLNLGEPKGVKPPKNAKLLKSITVINEEPKANSEADIKESSNEPTTEAPKEADKAVAPFNGRETFEKQIKPLHMACVSQIKNIVSAGRKDELFEALKGKGFSIDEKEPIEWQAVCTPVKTACKLDKLSDVDRYTGLPAELENVEKIISFYSSLKSALEAFNNG